MPRLLCREILHFVQDDEVCREILHFVQDDEVCREILRSLTLPQDDVS